MNLLLQLTTFLTLTGCMMGGVSHIDATDGFDWDSLKRDQIVMSHLLDLRVEKKAPHDLQDKLDFFNEKQQASYPEDFKQVFFKIRKDIRIFAAGGAFTNVNAIKGIEEAAKNALHKKPVNEATLKQIRSNNQGIRYIMFFLVNAERLEYTFNKSVSDEGCLTKTYGAHRYMDVKSVLWDSEKNETPWIGTKIVNPGSSYTTTAGPHHPTIRRLKRKARKAGRVYIAPKCGLFEKNYRRSTLATELKENKGRFPSIPEREPYFSDSFKDFALSLPMGQSERNWIEYDNFTNNRLGIAGSFGSFSNQSMNGVELQFSSRIYNRYRLGLRTQNLDSDTKNGISNGLFMYSISGMVEYDIHEKWQISVGALAGFATYSISGETINSANEPETITLDSETSRMFNPTISLQYGTKYGGQLYLMYVHHNFVDFEMAGVDNKNHGTSLNLGVTYTWLGF